MFHKIKSVQVLSDFQLRVQFAEGISKIYDVKPLFDKWPAFRQLKASPGLFAQVKVDDGGYGIVWNDDIDLSCDEIFANGKTARTPFDRLMAFRDATQLWGLNESTLRKAISYGKLVEGIDVCKFGKQWVISMDAMIREYGEPQEDIAIYQK